MQSETPTASPVRASQRELIELAGQARNLSLAAVRVRARKGGDWLSRLRGRGMEFDEARPYQPGDDPRNIDWRVTARTGKPFTKIFREERERPVVFLLDLRASMHFATRGVYKSVQAARIVALIAWAAEQHGDRTGGFLFAEHFHTDLRPRLGRRSVLKLIHEITNAPVWEPASADPALAAACASRAFAGLRKVEKSGSLVVLLTDGRNLDKEAMTYLADIGRNNDVMVFFTYDPFEATAPPAGRYPIVAGSERGVLSTDSEQRRRRYERHFEARRETLAVLAQRHAMHFLELATNDDPVALARTVFGRRSV